MACFRPIRGYRARSVNSATGRRPVVFTRKAGYEDLAVDVPCGQCIGCRLERSRQWAMRCSHEASLHEDNCFITLTYDPEHYPRDGSLSKPALQKFFKRLRKRRGKFRYYACGEYGNESFRAHYHAILFGLDFPDKVLYTTTQGNELFISPELASIWQFGFSTIGNVSFESCAYVVRYCMKKVTGEEAEAHYRSVDPETGEIYAIEPEFALMSRRPGIGRDWFLKFRKDV